MTKRLGIAASLTGAILLAGCTTHLEVGQGDPNLPASRRGIAYFLPFTQFENKVTWSLACDDKGAASLVPKVESTAKTARDPSEVYVIDYSSLDAWHKTSSVKVDFYDSGAIKSINAAADDRTAEIAGKAITAIGKVAKFVAAAGGDTVVPTCNADAVSALGEVKRARESVMRLTARLASETASLDLVTARILRSGESTGAAVRRSHDRLVGQVSATQFELDRAKKLLQGKLEAVTYSDVVVFPDSSEIFESSEGVTVPLARLRKWLKPLSDSKATDFASLSSVHFLLSSKKGWEKGKAYEDGTFSRKESRQAGIRYRVGVPGILTVCQGAKCSDDLATTREELSREKVTILQRGTTFYMPFSSAAFTNASLSATFSEAGVLTSAGYEQKRAQGEVIAGLGDTLADQFVTLGGVVQNAKLTDLEKLKEQTDLAKAKKELADAEKALVQAPKGDTAVELEALNADTEIKRAELTNIEAELALRKARAERDALSNGN